MRSRCRSWVSGSGLAVFAISTGISFSVWSQAADRSAPPVVAELVAELRKGHFDSQGRPLPVAGHWANGFGTDNFSSDYQIALLGKGHHLIPTLPMPRPGRVKYLPNGIAQVTKLQRWNAPFTLRGGQWEQLLLSKDHPSFDPGNWRNLSPEKSPLVIDRASGKVIPLISPWGAIEPWTEVGKYETTSVGFREFQDLYPNPPFVILLSNNEASRLKIKQGVGRTSQRYLVRWGSGRSASFKRSVMAEGYVERYRALLAGMTEGFVSHWWKTNSIFVAYNAFGPANFGRWNGWQAHSLAAQGRVSPWHLAWDGGSAPYYTHNWSSITDYQVFSVQIEAMNWVFMLDEAYRENPDFWFELSVWDGNVGKGASFADQKQKMNQYIRGGTKWSAERYAGSVQFGMWLMTPRVVREFRGYRVKLEDFQDEFEALVAAVDRVWTDPLLTRFWRFGELVPNRNQRHPYQSRIPKEWQDEDRWFLLDTDLDPPRPWKLETQIPVFSLARVLGEMGSREWLVYAHSPLKDRQGVLVRIPRYGTIRIDVSVQGNFYVVYEKTRRVLTIKPPTALPAGPPGRTSKSARP